MIARALRRALHVSMGVLAAAMLAAAVGAGLVDDGARARPSLPSILLFGAVVILVITSAARRIRFVRPSARAQRVSFWVRVAEPLADVEVTLGLITGVYAVLAVTGGLTSPFYPALYGVIAFAVTFQGRAGAWTSALGAMALEGAALARVGLDADAVLTAGIHAGLIVVAAVAHAVFLRGLALRLRADHRSRVTTEILAQREAARDYRLIAAALGADSRGAPTRMEEEHLLAVGGVQAIASSLYYVMALIKSSLGARTVILMWLDDRTERLKIKELVTDSDHVTESSEVKASGVVGAVLRDGKAISLSHAKAGQVPYFESGESVGAFAGVPVLDGPHLRGVLCADRARPFTDDEVAVLAGASDHVLRSIQAEHVFRSVERAKYEHERFYQSSAMLCEALTVEQVMETAFSAAAQIVEHDIAAISLFDAEQKMHRVLSVRVREGAEKMLQVESLNGLEFRPNSGLVSMVVKNKHYLPAGGELRDAAPHVFTKRVKLRDAESLLVLPLMTADEAIGTFTLVSRNPRRFRKDVREMLRIIANQVAVSIQNALMYRKMETMATTDGLTGLTNHRTFQERFGNLVERADRHGHRAAVLLCDVDHFKSVNDNYGHPVGDEVLRQVAAVLRAAVRKIDIPARYGGEEFAVVLEETDLEGAVMLANRIRKDVGALMLESDKGTFQITMSVGVAAFPDDSRDRAELIERADMALYHAKETGRNRVVSYQEFQAARQKRAS
jgi:diguanylate cyclase (GGDEF)-like protein